MGMNKAHWLCSVATASLLLIHTSGAGLAQEAEAPGMQDQVAEEIGSEALETIVVVGNYNGDRFAEAADRNTSIYISETAVQAAETGDLKDLFAEEASVTVGGGIPIAQKIYVNGVDMLNLNVTIDGAMQNNRSFHHVTANSIDPGLLKAVRVDAGVAAADSGPNAIAGSVAFETKDALDLLEDGQTAGGKVILSADSNSKTFSESLTLYGRQGGFDFLGYAKNAKGEEYTTGDDWKIPGTAADLQSLMLKAGFTTESNNRFEAAAQILRDSSLRPYRANFGALPSKPTQTVRLYDSIRKNFSFNFYTDAPTDFWDPEVNLGFSENEIAVPVPYGSKGVSNTLNGKVANSFHFADVNTVTTGFDFYKKGSTYSGPSVENEEESLNIGAFAQVRLQPIDPLKLSFGTRFDAQKFEGVAGQKFDVSGLSGNASAAYEIVDGLILKAGYANVFGGIALEDNYTFEKAWNYTGLKPARSQNVTAGFEAKKWNFTLSGEVYQTDVKNARSSVYNYKTKVMTRNNVDFVTQGFNVGLGYNWQNGFAKLTYSNNSVKVDNIKSDSYTALDLAAPLGQVIAFNIAHTFQPYNLTVGGNIDAALDYDTGSTGSSKDLEGYTVVNLFAEYEPEQVKGLSLRLAANNIFDKDYADRGTYGGDYNSVTELSEPGRSFLATVKYKF
ncbi:TonB-dependent receptor domain-containing protein [Cohaesibacter gelatinilyticus]|uniref:Hemoglobin/transferrin/lactoferrin receptor protein n=1 Tax=Cohaesibacter gelatinilyticus TaxID=372072 RepID=A0A285PF71_9HYPH|nr:TonB-dependent receptor [Cohaesibacter gelatinilyticus]SNZ20359.1 hemoglobin/transferrin/lactoferrin receptor protein [Cohaesibacter gelatinilyticus]